MYAMKRLLCLIIMFALLICTCPAFAYAKTMDMQEKRLDYMSDTELKEVADRYGLEMVSPDDVPEGITPIKVTYERQLLNNTKKPVGSFPGYESVPNAGSGTSMYMEYRQGHTGLSHFYHTRN